MPVEIQQNAYCNEIERVSSVSGNHSLIIQRLQDQPSVSLSTYNTLELLVLDNLKDTIVAAFQSAWDLSNGPHGVDNP
jgi:hypothetical protein